MAVFRRPVLWNMRIDIYRDKNKTNQAWKEIGEEFGLPEKDCKKRWRDLRDRYVRERRDASGTTASGSAGSNRRPWCHAGLMAFIDPFVASRMTTSNMPESCENGRAAGAAVAPGRKRRAGRAEAPMPAFERNLMLALERTAGPSLPTIPVVDEDHHFLLSLLPSLRRLELSKKALLKLQIHRLIYEAVSITNSCDLVTPVLLI
ncbi:unnamed protein product [Arctogadus glacialis]